MIGVDPSAQGIGLGSVLLRHGLASLYDRGAREVLLYVDGSNTTAMQLYERYGFGQYDLDVQWSNQSAHRFGVEHVAEATHRAQVATRARPPFQLLAQPQDVHGDRPRIAVELRAPQRGQDRRARHDVIGVGHQQLEQPELLHREHERMPAHRHQVRGAIEHDVSGVQSIRRPGRGTRGRSFGHRWPPVRMSDYAAALGRLPVTMKIVCRATATA